MPRRNTSKVPNDDWLKIIYTETWTQYAHENQIAQTRGTIFIALLTAMLAALGVLSPFVIAAPCVVINGYKIYLGLIFLGALWILTVVFLRKLTNSFEKVTLAVQGYVNIRSATLRIVEAVSGLGMFGPSLLEDEWRNKSSKSEESQNIQVITNMPEMENYTKVPRYNFAGGFNFFRETIATLRSVYFFLQVTGVALIITGSIGALFNLHIFLQTLCT